MAMLDTVQRFCRRRGLSVPNSVLGSSDPQIRQIYSLLEEEGNDLASRGDWTELTFEASHTTVATASQGTIESVSGSNNFSHIKNDTFWDFTNDLPVAVVTSQEWVDINANGITGSYYYYTMIRGGTLYAYPTPTAGLSWKFHYVTNNWILGADGTTYSQYFNLDTDTFLLPEKILVAGLTWRWKKEKGLSYAEDFNTYERLVADALGRSGLKKTFHMDNSAKDATPGILVPDGSWSL